MVFLDDFYTEEECDFLIKYFHENYCQDYNNGTNDSEILQIMLRRVQYDFSVLNYISAHPLKRWFHFRANMLRWRCLRRIQEEFPFTRLMYDQLVHWPDGTFMDFHYDRKYTPWASVCYLNDDYSGGETVIEGKKIEPKRGRLIVFNGSKFIHGVNPVNGDRYTYTSWLGVK